MRLKLLLNILSSFDADKCSVNLSLEGFDVFDGSSQRLHLCKITYKGVGLNRKHPQYARLKRMIEAHLKEWNEFAIYDLEKKRKADLAQITLQ